MLKNIFVIVMAAILFLPQTVLAHTTLTEAIPGPDAHLVSSPEQVVLTFDERLENKLFYIKVLDQDGKQVTSDPAIMNEQQLKISVQLPELSDGIYTVAYKVISADGHPISKSYVFTIGENTASVTQPPPSVDAGSSHQHESGLTSGIDVKQIIFYLSRIAYFIGMLLLAGWIFFGQFIRFDKPELRASYDLWSLRLKRFFLIAVLIMITVHLQDYLEVLDKEQLISLLFGTAIGISWMSSLLLALLSFIVLGRSKWIAGIWVLLLLATKSISGHAMAFEPPIRTVALDIIHLFAAAIWAGGLFFIIVHWRKYKEQMLSFMPRFSNFAFVSLIALAVTGTISTLIFIPSIKYLLYTQWGILLLIKCGLVVLVIAAGAILRYMMRKKQKQLGTLLKVDFSLMLLIVVIVGIFTYLTPQPVNEPLKWHKMGETIHLTAKISPKAPGDNSFNVIVWLPEKPKTVQLFLKYKDDKDIAPIEVPLTLAPSEEEESFLGFKEFGYLSEGPYIPFPGKWIAEIRVMDENDDETVNQIEMMVY